MSDSDSSLSAVEISHKKRKKVAFSRTKSKKSRKAKAGPSLFEDEVEEASEDESDLDKEAGYEATVKEISRHERETNMRYEERRRAQEAFEQMSEKDIARRLEERHDKIRSSQFSRSGVANASLSRNANLPTVTDPKLYAVRCKPGQERLLVVRLMNRFLAEKGKLQILSAVSPGTKGYIYVEAYTEGAVKKALYGLRDVFQRLALIPLKQMTSVMTVTVAQAKQILKQGMFARLRKFPYKGDLCQIMKVLHGENKVVVRMVPRIDYDLLGLQDEDLIRQRRAQKVIPPRELLRPDRVQTEKGVKSSIGEWIDYVPVLDSYFSEGLLVEDISTRLLDFKEVNPGVEELRAFKAFEDANVMNMLNKAKKGAEDVGHGLAVGDSVRVVKGELRGVTGKILEIKRRFKIPQKESLEQEKSDFIDDDLEEETAESKSTSETVVKIQPFNEEIKSEVLEFSPEQLRKLFSIGNHVKLMNGEHMGETGIVVEVSEDKDTAFIFSDVSKKEITAKLSDIKLTNETSGGRDSLLDYKMYDFVKLASGGVAVVVNIGADTLTVLDSSQRVATVPVNSVLSKVNLSVRRHGIVSALDKQNNQIKINDKVRLLDGKYRGLEGTVRFINKNVVFVFSRQVLENAGMLSTFSRGVSLIGGSAARRLTLQKGAQRGRDRNRQISYRKRQSDGLKGQSVKIAAGKYKGYVGIVVDIRDKMVKVELHTKSKSITIDRNRVRVLSKRGEDHPSKSTGQEKVIGRALVDTPPTPLYNGVENDVPDKLPKKNLREVRTPAIHLQGSLQPKTPALTLQEGGRTPGLSLQNMKTPGLTMQGMKTPGLTMQNVKTPGLTLQSIKTPGLTLQAVQTPGLTMAGEPSNDKYQLGEGIVVLSGRHKGKRGKVQACDGGEVIVNLHGGGDLAIFKLGQVSAE